MQSSAGPASVVVDGYTVLVDTRPPVALGAYMGNAELIESFDNDDGDSFGFVALSSAGEDFPSLVVHGRFTAAGGKGPGVVVVPETQLVLIGAGTSVAGFDRRSGPWRLAWRDTADCGFWGWSRAGDVILMSAELELAAWTVSGDKLWTRFVEPPWSYSVDQGTIRLNVMGTVTEFPLAGPPA